MDYRETYGDQIRLPKWRAQFVGKKNGDVLKIDQPILNIAGATLSCVHVTDGVRRILATYAMIAGVA
jgi:Na+-transporting NADH:ubiquinone oxidoreductase subunit NqrC